jgi:uncharacterized membrane protein
MSDRHGAEPELTTQRIEAFSDGVFAIAITLLILEIKVPHDQEASGHAPLQGALLRLWPSYFAYVLSFLVIGIYWANHHYVFKLYKRTDHVFLLLNVLFLMCISFLPLPTAVLGGYILDEMNQATAVRFYALGLLLPAASWLLMWLYANKGGRLIDPHLDPEFLRGATTRYIVSVGLYVGAVLVALVNWRLSLAICVGLTLLYLLPPKRPVYVHPAQ